MYQNTVSTGAERIRASSKFGKLVRFVAGAMGLGIMAFGALPDANAQTYNLTTLSNFSLSGGSNTIINLAGTQRAAPGNPGTHTSVDISNTWTINGASNNFVNFTVNLTYGFQPAPGDDFHIFNYGAIAGTSTQGGFMPPAVAPRYINYNMPALSEDYYVWTADWSIPNEMWFRVEALENKVGLNITSHGDNHGTAIVTGSNGNYIPGVVVIVPPPGENDGHISIQGPFPEIGPPGELWVLADLEGYDSMTDFMNTISLFVDSPLIQYELAGDSNFEAMRAKFGSDWEVLLKFQGLPAGATNSNMKFNWSFERDSDVTVERLLVVPEPATMFMFVGGLLGLMNHRPRGRARYAA